MRRLRRHPTPLLLLLMLEGARGIMISGEKGVGCWVRDKKGLFGYERFSFFL